MILVCKVLIDNKERVEQAIGKNPWTYNYAKEKYKTSNEIKHALNLNLKQVNMPLYIGNLMLSWLFQFQNNKDNFL